MLNSQETRSIETSREVEIGEITFRNAGKILLSRVFRWVTNIHEHKDITIPLIIRTIY